MKEKLSQTGQSVVETALVLPILIMLIAGIVEFSNLIITKNRIASAAGAAARFGTRGGEDEGMAVVALNAITQTMDMDPQKWDMWSIRGQVNQNGDGFVSPPVWEHIYGNQQTATYTETVQRFNNSEIQDEILAELVETQLGVTNADAKDIEFVGAYLSHDTDFILGFDALADLARSSKTMSQLHVMRRTGLDTESTDGCTGVLPIVVEEGVRSVKEVQYPAAGSFDHPSPAPDFNRFIHNVEDIPLDHAKEGYIFLASGGKSPGDFYWAKWNELIGAGAGTVANSLAFPGNSHIYTGSPAPGYMKYGDISDHSMHQGENLGLNDFGNWDSGAIAAELREHLDQKRTFRVPTYRHDPTNTAPYVTINGFAVIRLRGYNLETTPSNSWLLFEFVRWDNSCGQAVNN